MNEIYCVTLFKDDAGNILISPVTKYEQEQPESLLAAMNEYGYGSLYSIDDPTSLTIISDRKHFLELLVTFFRIGKYDFFDEGYFRNYIVTIHDANVDHLDQANSDYDIINFSIKLVDDE